MNNWSNLKLFFYMICRAWYCPSLMFSLCYKFTNNLLDFLDVFKHRVFILESDQNAHVHLDFYKIKTPKTPKTPQCSISTCLHFDDGLKGLGFRRLWSCFVSPVQLLRDTHTAMFRGKWGERHRRMERVIR